MQAWAVPDAALRFALKDVLAEQLVPLYQAFYNKYKAAPYTGANVFFLGRAWLCAIVCLPVGGLVGFGWDGALGMGSC